MHLNHIPQQRAISFLFVCLLLIELTAVFAGRGPQAAPAASDQTSQLQIIAEVKKTQEMVRQAVKELYLTRRLIHHERLHSLQSALDQLREEMSEAQADYQLTAQQLRELEEEIARESDPDKLRVMREDQAEQMRRLEKHSQRQVSAQRQETQFLTDIETEKANLAAINSRLATIEREFAPKQ